MKIIFLEQGKAPEVAVVNKSFDAFHELIGQTPLSFFDVNIDGVPFVIVYDEDYLGDEAAIDTVLFYNDYGNVIGNLSGSIIITRKKVGKALGGSLRKGDIEMIMSRITSNDEGSFYLPIYAGEDPYFTPFRE